METETEVVRLDVGAYRHRVTRAELQAIVQQAYDQHGILAEPSYAAEAAAAVADPRLWSAK